MNSSLGFSVLVVFYFFFFSLFVVLLSLLYITIVDLDVRAKANVALYVFPAGKLPLDSTSHHLL